MRTGSFHQPISLLSICDARLPTRTTQSKQRLDGNARVDPFGQIPRFDRSKPREVIRPSR
jgi:hypothetical protein